MGRLRIKSRIDPGNGQPLHVPIEDPRSRIEKFGHVRPTISTDFKGHKIVGIGNQLFESDKWKTFAGDFLNDYLQHCFGKEWWMLNVKKPTDQMHPVIRWAWEKFEYMKRTRIKEGGLYVVTPNGATMAYNSLAYDLYCLQHSQKLQDSLIARMRHQDQFRGARYEALVAATFVRAGFDFTYEDENDGTRMHPEFVAVDKATGARIAVEAKSRHHDHPNTTEADVKLGVVRIIKKALAKYDGTPFAIFVDLNVPQIGPNPIGQPWYEEIKSSINRAGARNEAGNDIFNLIAFTNHPVEFVGDDVPKFFHLDVMSLVPKNPLDGTIINRIRIALDQFGKIPNSFEE